MKQNETILVPKGSESSVKFYCELCDYITSRKSQIDRHYLTHKHQKRENETNETEVKQKSSEKVPGNILCRCGVYFNSRTTLWRHKNKCKMDNTTKSNNISNEKNSSFNITSELIMELIKDNKDMKNIILEQNNTINNLVKNGINNNVNTNSLNNNNNKTFNLQFFLNETCKNAMNIMDFVETIKLQLSDLEKIGEIGYVQGISNIITTNLKALDVTQRPVHCTDKKRETMYIKDENKWEKEDDNKSKIRKAIKKVANKNIKLLPQFREKHPDYDDAESTISDKYSKMVVEAMGGTGNNDLEKEDKIIHNISKCTVVEKIIEMD
jgi:hypothetical protein